MSPTNEQMASALSDYYSAGSWSAKRAVVVTQRDVFLSDEFDESLVMMLEYFRDDPGQVHSISKLRMLFARCRSEGIDKAFADLLSEERLKQQAMQAVITFINAPIEKQQQVLDESLDVLYSDAAQSAFAQLLDDYSEKPSLVCLITDQRELLDRCKKAGVETAFAERAAALKLLQPLRTADECWQRINENFPLLCTGYAYNVLVGWITRRKASLAEDGEGETTERKILYEATEICELLLRCCEVGADAAFEERGSKLVGDYVFEAINLLSITERSNDWAVTKRFLRDVYPDLLMESVQRSLTEGGWMDDFVLHDIPFGPLLARCRREGMDVAFADLIEFGMDVPESLRDSLRRARAAQQRYDEVKDRMSLDEAAYAWTEVLDNPDRFKASLRTQRSVLIEAGNTYEDRYRERDELEDLSQVLNLWQEAATKVPERDLGDEWSKFLNYLGHSIHVRYKRTHNIDDLDRAIRYYQDAYQTSLHRSDDPLGQPPPPAPFRNEDKRGPDAFDEWRWRQRQRAKYLHSVGEGYYDRYNTTENVNDLSQAIDHYQKAVDQAIDDDSVLLSFRDSLGWALFIRYLYHTKDTADLAASVETYEKALQLSNNDDHAVFQMLSAFHFGQILYTVGRTSEALEALGLAHQALQKTRVEQTSQRARLNLAHWAASIYALAVPCCLKKGDISAAFYFATAAKGRTFVDVLAQSRFYIGGIGPNRPELYTDLQPYLQLRDQIDDFRLALLNEELLKRPQLDRVSGDGAGIQKVEIVLQELRRKEQVLWEDIVSRYPFLAAVADVPPLTADQACCLAKELGATLIEYYRHAMGWGAFVVTPDSVHYVELPLLTDELLRRLLRWVEVATQRSGRNLLSYNRLAEWHSAVIGPLREYLLLDRPVLVAPFGSLHLLPFGAALDLRTGRYAIDDYSLAFAPSLASLSVLWQRIGKKAHTDDDIGGITRVMSVAYPGSEKSRHFLSHVAIEAQAVIDAVVGYWPEAQPTLLRDGEATPDNVIAHASNQDIVHLGCHGYFDSEFPAQSGLLLAGGWLTVQRMITELRLEDTMLFTMAACVSGRVDLNAGDELVGLTQAALTSGASVVVSSLWSVNDIATRFLFDAFYRGVAQGKSAAQAMRDASLEIRNHKGWEHPSYWAPFVVSGLGHIQLADNLG